MDLCSSSANQQWSLEHLLSGLGCRLPSKCNSLQVRKLVTLTNARGAGDLCFLSEPRRLKELLKLPSNVLCLLSPDHARLARARGTKALLIETQEPKQVWCMIIQRVFGAYDEPIDHCIHPSAIIANGVHLHKPLQIGAYSIIAEGVHIGAGTRIESHCVLEKDVKIGERCHIAARVFIAHSKIDDEVTVHEDCLIGGQDFGIMRDKKNVPYNFPQLGKVVIGKASQIFMATTIGRGTLDDTTIGKHVRIGCKSLIAHNCEIGDYTIISSRCALSGSTRIGRYVTTGAAMETAQNVTLKDRVGIGGQCSFWPNVTLSEGVQLMNGSTVKHNLQGDGKIFFGNPAIPLREELHRRKKIDSMVTN